MNISRTAKRRYYKMHRKAYLAYNNKWEAQNKETILDLMAARRQRNRERLTAIKKVGKCLHCPVKDYRVLEFAHKKGIKKTSDFSIGRGWKTLEKELKKSILLCANCHIIYDWDDKEKRRQAQRRK